MWLNVPEARDGDDAVVPSRRLTAAGTITRRQRTVVASVAIAAVEPNPQQPRKHFAADKLAELAESIRVRGLLQPIVVQRCEDGRFLLLAGERRFRAAQLAGIERVPALVRDGDDPLEIALIENVQREDLAPLEEAEALAQLIERHGYNHRTVAELLGKSRPYVSNTLALNRLPDPVKSALHRDGHVLSREVLMGIARADTQEAALAMWKRVQLDAMSVRRFRAEREGKTPVARSASRNVLLAARRLGRALRRWPGDEAVVPTEAADTLRALRRTRSMIDRQITRLEHLI